MKCVNPNEIDSSVSYFKKFKEKPEIVIFNDFEAEEMYSPFIYAFLPESSRILDF